MQVAETFRRFSLPAATAGATVVEEVSRHWRYETNSAGDIVLALIAVEILYYVVSVAYLVWRWVRGKKTEVTVYRDEWRSRTRERVLRVKRPKNLRHRNPHEAMT